MNKIYIHSKQDMYKSIFKWIISIFPLLLYGIYKNGILLYNKGLISFGLVFRPLIFVLAPFIIYLLLNLIKEKKLKIDYLALSWLLIGFFTPPYMSITTYCLVVFVCVFISIFLPKKINWSLLAKLSLVIILLIYSAYNYQNLLEMETEYSFSYLDLLWGRSIGGVCSTSAIFAVVCFCILLTDPYYKKEIPIISSITYFILGALYYVIFHDLSLLTTNIAGVLLAFITLASIPNYAPYIVKARMIYAVSLAILTFIINIWIPYDGIFIALFITSIFTKYFDKMIISIHKG